MSTHVDVTWYGCPLCHMIWPDNRECCEFVDGDPQPNEVEWPMSLGATLSYFDELPDDGGMHPTITKYGCAVPDSVRDALGVKEIPSHPFHRAAWLVQFDPPIADPAQAGTWSEPTFDDLTCCHQCARDLFGVEPP